MRQKYQIQENSIEDEATIPVVKPYIIPLKPKKKRVSSKPSIQTDNINLSICGECDMQEPANEVRCLEDCKKCKVSFENLSQPSRLLLHYHNKLDHMGFDAIRALARRGFMPKCLIRANAVKCAACQAGKAHSKSASKKGKLINQNINEPGDLVHMDQAQSSTPGRPITYSD